MGLFFRCKFKNIQMAPTKDKAKAAPAKKAPVPKKTVEKKSDEKVKKAPIRSVQKAQKVQRKVVKGTHGTRVKKVRTTVQFKGPGHLDQHENQSFLASLLQRETGWMLTTSLSTP